ncbi:MAG: PAS domain S-box protein [Anaerolineae bacterium]|nr:PAS domain S-box protein [Anaerolineae bacterium]
MDVERQDVEVNVQRLANSLTDDNKALGQVTNSLAFWDDTYTFIEDNNEKYIEDNLYDEIFAEYRTNLQVFVNIKGEVVYSKAVDIAKMEDIAVPAGFSRYLGADSPLLAKNETDRVQYDGVILVDDRPMMVSSRGILTSRLEGPVHGTLICGRFIDDAKIKQLSDATKLHVTAYTPNNSALDKHVLQQLEAIQDGFPLAMNILNEDQVEAFTVIDDYEGKPALILKVDFARKIYAQGQSGLQTFTLLLGIADLVFVVVSLFLLSWTVLKPLTRLSSDVSHIRTSGNLADRVIVHGRDELAALGQSINQMMNGLQQSHTMVIESEARYRTLFENTHDLIQYLDAQGKFVYVNQAWHDATGYQPSDLATLSMEALLRPADVEVYRTLIQDLKNNKTPFAPELHLLTKQGREIIVTADFVVQMRDGKFYATVGLLHDITARIEAESRIQDQNRSLRETNLDLAEARRVAEENARLKSQFLSTMSHELRTPLNAVIGYSEIMLEGMSGEMNDEQTDNIKRIHINALHLLTLINDVLDLSKIEAGRLVVVPLPFLINDLMDEVMYQTNVLIGAKPIQMRYTLDPKLPREVLADYGRLKQIIINLLSNATKFTDRGEIRLDVAKVDTDKWSITVTDTGIGIPSHALEYIFEEFRQVDGSEQRRYGGTGLGLAIVKRLVLLMNGTIRVTSKVGEGSTFIVTLPLVVETVEVQS